MSTISIRPLDPSEWAAFKSLRLDALKLEPGLFWASYDEAAAKSEEAWRATIKGAANRRIHLG